MVSSYKQGKEEGGVGHVTTGDSPVGSKSMSKKCHHHQVSDLH